MELSEEQEAALKLIREEKDPQRRHDLKVQFHMVLYGASKSTIKRLMEQEDK